MEQGVKDGHESEELFLSAPGRYGWLLLLLGLIGFASLFMLQAGYTDTALYPIGVVALTCLFRLLPLKYPVFDPLRQLPRAIVAGQTRPILIWAIVFPLLLIPVVLWMRVQLIPLLPSWTNYYLLSWNYTVVGKIMLLFLPTAYFVWRYGGNASQLGIRGMANLWGWIVPLGSVLLYTGLYAEGVWHLSESSGRQIPFGLVLLLWVLTLLAAGWTEEYFYRVMLQTRLERLMGRWNGLALATLLFGLLHLPSRYPFVWLGQTRSGSPLYELTLAAASVLLLQTTLGLFLGYMWMRFRNAWAQVVLHTAIDALAFIAIVLNGSA